MTYDSTAETLKHSLRVGELMGHAIHELVDRSVHHDLSKTRDPELAVFNEYTPKLRDTTYGSDEYKGHLAAMGEGLAHHYASNRHHPEHFTDGVNGMTLMDLVEMLADWRAATERHADGSLAQSLQVQRERFGISDQLAQILANTAGHLGWLDRDIPPCGVAGRAPNGDALTCTDRAGHRGDLHADGTRDNLEWADGEVAGIGVGEWRLVGTLPTRDDPNRSR